MPVQLKPYKLICPKCGYTKIVTPKSDALSIEDLKAMSSICPKCKEQMEKKDTNMLDDIFNIFSK